MSESVHLAIAFGRLASASARPACIRPGRAYATHEGLFQTAERYRALIPGPHTSQLRAFPPWICYVNRFHGEKSLTWECFF
ncbi:hypothetical protein LshimejAT787_0901830 [Lyophyllum shimeji]|uniref:Uncharacterized protein n=1 Tax=Lyophyllum shimeji TaxID=47721 RepID=A0A9P3PSV9_LYOSH|nr:hypothetical protein LshimejAT787_0901830 [Lyophyllum shimeji]